MENMKKLNEKNIMVTYRNINYFSIEDGTFTISTYSPTIGIIMDWSCNERTLSKVSVILHFINIIENI